MSIIKNEIPILEFDTDASAIIEPTHSNYDLRLPKKAVFAFLRDRIDIYAKEHGAGQVGEFKSATKIFPIYVTDYKGENICICQAPVGAAPATQMLDFLIGYGAKEIISAGSCGALSDIPENTFLIPYRSLRDEGTSYHYMAPSRFVDTDKKALNAIKKALTQHRLKYREVVTWSTDGFFRETRAKVEYRRSEGCETVEMECSALAACAKFRGAVWGSILYTADTLADAEKYDPRNWGGDAAEYALGLSLDAVLNI